MRGKPGRIRMIRYELRNLNGNLMSHFFGIVFPNLMSFFISKAACAQIPADMQPQAFTSIMLGMSLIMPMSTMLLGYGAVYSQEVERGVPLRMHLFGIHERSLLFAKIAAHFILLTVEFVTYALFQGIMMDIQKPALVSVFCILLSLYLLGLILLVLSHAIANLLRRFSFTFGIEMFLYFVIMILSGMMGVKTEQLPEVLQKVAKTLPMSYYTQSDFVDFWQGGDYNFVPLLQAFIFMGAVTGIILMLSLRKERGGAWHDTGCDL